MKFEWDESKKISNLEKHGISFEEAQTVFDNPLAVIFDDPQHSIGEIREIIIGHSRQNQLLLVVFRERSGVIRIISARLATRREGEDYEQNRL
jgi:uncharacterized DUF497 family protein